MLLLQNSESFGGKNVRSEDRTSSPSPWLRECQPATLPACLPATLPAMSACNPSVSLSHQSLTLNVQIRHL